MTTMVPEVYDAFLAAGAPEEKARKAAEAIANCGQRSDSVDRGTLKARTALLLLKWMFGFAIALDVALLIRVFLQ